MAKLILLRTVLWFVLDASLKSALGILLVTILWIPFYFMSASSFKPWFIAGLIVGLILNGLWELEDVFGLKKWFKI